MGVPIAAQQKWIRLVSKRIRVWSLASLSGLRIWHCHELWFRSQTRLGFGIAVAVLRCRPEAAALIRPLAWELPYALSEALKRKKNKTKQKTTNNNNKNPIKSYLSPLTSQEGEQALWKKEQKTNWLGQNPTKSMNNFFFKLKDKILYAL